MRENKIDEEISKSVSDARTKKLGINGLRVINDQNSLFRAVEDPVPQVFCDEHNTTIAKEHCKKTAHLTDGLKTTRSIHDIYNGIVTDPEIIKLDFIYKEFQCPYCKKINKYSHTFYMAHRRITCRLSRFLFIQALARPVKQVAKNIDNKISATTIQADFDETIKALDAIVSRSIHTPKQLSCCVLHIKGVEMVLICDIEKRILIEVLDITNEEKMEEFFKSLNKEQVEIVFTSPDARVVRCIESCFPKDKICVSRTEIKRWLNSLLKHKAEATGIKNHTIQLLQKDANRLSPRQQKAVRKVLSDDPSLRKAYSLREKAGNRRDYNKLLSTFEQTHVDDQIDMDILMDYVPYLPYMRNGILYSIDLETFDLDVQAIEAILLETYKSSFSSMRGRILYSASNFSEIEDYINTATSAHLSDSSASSFYDYIIHYSTVDPFIQANHFSEAKYFYQKIIQDNFVPTLESEGRDDTTYYGLYLDDVIMRLTAFASVFGTKQARTTYNDRIRKG